MAESEIQLRSPDSKSRNLLLYLIDLVAKSGILKKNSVLNTVLRLELRQVTVNILHIWSTSHKLSFTSTCLILITAKNAWS